MFVMVAHARALRSVNSHVRQIDPWRDGRAVANLLEAAFHDEVIDESGERMLSQLRNYGVYEAMSFGYGTGFVWVEEGEVIANASVQRNGTRRDTWMIGNVATRADMRNRGIGRALVDACIQYAAQKRARFVALQADAENKPALHLYAQAGFERVGDVVHYSRPNARQSGVYASDISDIRPARWRDRTTIWSLMQANMPDVLTFAEPFDNSIYRLGLGWSLANALNGNLDQWLVLPAQTGRAGLVSRPGHDGRDGRDGRDGTSAALRTHANIEGHMHQLELLLADDGTADHGRMLIEQGLRRLDSYVRKPIYAAQAQPHDAAHQALQVTGFSCIRTLAHMRLMVEGQ